MRIKRRDGIYVKKEGRIFPGFFHNESRLPEELGRKKRGGECTGKSEQREGGMKIFQSTSLIWRKKARRNG